MQSKRVLIPVDLAKPERSYDALQFVGGMAGDLRVHATLLYVVNHHGWTPERKSLDQYDRVLKTFAARFLADCTTKCFRVRTGKPDQEILREAKEASLELIVLSQPDSGRSTWFRSRTAERIIRAAPCLTLVLPASWKITSDKYREVLKPLEPNFAN